MHQLPVSAACQGEILLAVFDGHGEQGHKVSSHFKTRLPALLASSAGFNLQPTAALKEALLIAEREVIDDVGVDTTLSGSTGVVTILRAGKWVCALSSSRC
jgi:serine/threonine protein phosphatase PrpC